MKQLMSEEEVAEVLKTYSGISEASAQDWLMDALSIAPILLGMPTGVVSTIPRRVIMNYRALKRQDERIIKKIENWLLGKGERPAAPSRIFRGIPKGSTLELGEQFIHGSPWREIASRGGKGAFGDPRSYDVYQYATDPSTLYYRGGSLAGDPLESGRIMSAQGMTWDKILNKGRGIFKRDLAQLEYVDEYTESWVAKKAANEIKRASFEVDIGNKPGIWRQKIVPKELRKEWPKLRSYQDLEEVVERAKILGLTEAELAELPESIILKNR